MKKTPRTHHQRIKGRWRLLKKSWPVNLPSCRSRNNNGTISDLACKMADDFNNILTVILGACSLINSNSATDGELARSVNLIKESAEHAAELAGRLAYISEMHSATGFRPKDQSGI